MSNTQTNTPNKQKFVKKTAQKLVTATEAQVLAAALKYESYKLKTQAEVVNNIATKALPRINTTANDYTNLNTKRTTQNYTKANGQVKTKGGMKLKDFVPSLTIITILALFIGSTQAANCNYHRINEISYADCFTGVFSNGIFNGSVWCECKCTRKWAFMDHANCTDTMPRRHILACRFGGPRHGYNCWNNQPNVEEFWTDNEKLLAITIKNNLNTTVYLDTNTLRYCINGICNKYDKLTIQPFYAKAASVETKLLTDSKPVTTPTLRNEIRDKVRENIHNYYSTDNTHAYDPKYSACGIDTDTAHLWAVYGNGNKSCLNSYFGYNLGCIRTNKKLNEWCAHGPSVQCAKDLNSQFNGNEFHVQRLEDNFTCCTLGCFSESETYLWMTYQPKCSNCMTPFVARFWPNCLHHVHGDQKVKILITKNQAILKINKEEFFCSNNYDFTQCCGGNGPSEIDECQFIDKLCCCSASTYTNKLFKHLQEFKNIYRVNSSNYLILLCIFLISFVIVPKFSVLAIIGLFIMYVPSYVFGACHVDNVLPLVNDLKDNNRLYFSKVYMSPAQCIMVGNNNLELLSISQNAEYKLVGYAPYKIKPLCNNFDWGCVSGAAESVWKKESQCYQHCDKNIRMSKTGNTANFDGDSCFNKISGIYYRVDTCYSVGPQNLVKVYELNDVLGNTNLQFFSHSGNSSTPILISTEEVMEVGNTKLFDFHPYPIETPHYVAIKGDTIFCSLYRLDISKSCIFEHVNDTNISGAHCITQELTWDSEKHTFKVAFESKDLESVLLNDFNHCELHYSNNENLNTILVSFKIPRISFMQTSSLTKQYTDYEHCNLSNIQINTVKTISAYHDITKVKILNKGANCQLSVFIDNCTSITPPTFIIYKSKFMSFYCNVFARGHVTLLGATSEFKTVDVVNNWKPHKTTLAGMKYVVQDNLNTTYYLNSVNKLFLKSLDYIKSWNLLSYVKFNISKIVISLIMLYLVYINAIRGKIIPAGVFFVIGYLAYFTDYIVAINLDTNIGFDISNIALEFYCLFTCLFNWYCNTFWIQSRITAIKVLNLIITALFYLILFNFVGIDIIYLIILFNICFSIFLRKRLVENTLPFEYCYVNPLALYLSKFVPIGLFNDDPCNEYDLYNTNESISRNFNYKLFVIKIFKLCNCWTVSLLFFAYMIRKVEASDDDDKDCLGNYFEVTIVLVGDFLRRLFNNYSQEDDDLYKYQLDCRPSHFRVRSQNFRQPPKPADIEEEVYNKYITCYRTGSLVYVENTRGAVKVKHTSGTFNLPNEDLENVKIIRKTSIKYVDIAKFTVENNFEMVRENELCLCKDLLTGFKFWAFKTSESYMSGTPMYYKNYFISLVNGYFTDKAHEDVEDPSVPKYYPIWNMTVEQSLEPVILTYSKFFFRNSKNKKIKYNKVKTSDIFDIKYNDNYKFSAQKDIKMDSNLNLNIFNKCYIILNKLYEHINKIRHNKNYDLKSKSKIIKKLRTRCNIVKTLRYQLRDKTLTEVHKKTIVNRINKNFDKIDSFLVKPQLKNKVNLCKYTISFVKEYCDTLFNNLDTIEFKTEKTRLYKKIKQIKNEMIQNILYIRQIIGDKKFVSSIESKTQMNNLIHNCNEINTELFESLKGLEREQLALIDANRKVNIKIDDEVDIDPDFNRFTLLKDNVRHTNRSIPVFNQPKSRRLQNRIKKVKPVKFTKVVKEKPQIVKIESKLRVKKSLTSKLLFKRLVKVSGRWYTQSVRQRYWTTKINGEKIHPVHINNDDKTQYKYFDIKSSDNFELSKLTKEIFAYHNYKKIKFHLVHHSDNFCLYETRDKHKLISGYPLFNDCYDICGFYNHTHTGVLVLPRNNFNLELFLPGLKYHVFKSEAFKKGEYNKSVCKIIKGTSNLPPGYKVVRQLRNCLVISRIDDTISGEEYSDITKSDENLLINVLEEVIFPEEDPPEEDNANFNVLASTDNENQSHYDFISTDVSPVLAFMEVEDVMDRLSDEEKTDMTLSQFCDNMKGRRDVFEYILKEYNALVLNDTHVCDICSNNPSVSNVNKNVIVKNDVENVFTIEINERDYTRIFDKGIKIQATNLSTQLRHLTYIISQVGINVIRLSAPSEHSIFNYFHTVDILSNCIVNNHTKMYIVIKESEDKADSVYASNFPLPQTLNSLDEYCMSTSKNIIRQIKKWRSNINPLDKGELLDSRKFSDDKVKLIDMSVLNNVYEEKDHVYFKILANLLGFGSGFSVNNSLVTAEHCTVGNDITEFRHKDDLYYKKHWKKFSCSKVKDICVYNSNFEFKECKEHEIVIAFNPIANWTQPFLVVSANSTLSSRRDVIFYSLLPLTIDWKNNSYEIEDNVKYQGMSGSPIFNVYGDIVGVYGLSTLYDSKDLNEHMLMKDTNGFKDAVISRYLLSNDNATKNVELYFDNIVLDVVQTKLEDPYRCHLVYAPTGVGKSTKFPVKLLKHLAATNTKKGTSIAISQPKRIAAIANFNRICTLLEMSEGGMEKYTVRLKMGVQQENENQTVGNGKDKITILTHAVLVYELLSKTQYDYVLFDEFHSNYDPSLTLAKITILNDSFLSRHKTKIILLSATISQEPWMHVTQQSQLVTTNFEIDESMVIGTSDSLDKSAICIPNKYLPSLSDQNNHKYWALPIPNGTLKGLGVILVQSRYETESICKYLNQHYKHLGPISFMHSKESNFQDLALKNTGIIVATDIIAQSVTLNNLQVLWDFQHTYKPHVQLDYDDNEVLCSEELRCKAISEFEKDQRKGRLGRTQAGYYIGMKSIEYTLYSHADNSTIVPAVVDLILNNSSFDRVTIDSYYPELAETCKNVISSLKNLYHTMDKMRFTQWINFLKIRTNIDTQWVMFLNKGYTKEQLKNYNNFDKLKLFKDAGEQKKYVEKLQNFTLIENKDIKATSFRDDPMGKVDEILSLLVNVEAMVHHTDDVSQESLSIVLIGSSLMVAVAGMTLSMYDNYSDRYVFENFKMYKNHVVPNIVKTDMEHRRVEVANKYSTFLSFITKIQEWLCKNLKYYFMQIKKFFSGSKKEITEKECNNMIMMIINSLKIKFLAGYGIVSASVGVGNLLALIGASATGMLWTSINEICGYSLGSIVIFCINALASLFLTPGMCVGFIGTQFITFFIERLLNKKTSHMLARTSNSGKDAWLGLLSSIAGSLTGIHVITPIIAGGSLILGASVTAGIVMPRTDYSNFFVTFKSIYYIFYKLFTTDESIDIFPMLGNLAVIFNSLVHGTIMHNIMLGVCAVIFAAVMAFISNRKIQSAANVRSDRALEWISNQSDNLEQFFNIMINVLALVGSPTSLLSVALHVAVNMATTDKNFRQSFTQAFYDYAGVHIFVAFPLALAKLLTNSLDRRDHQESSLWWIPIFSGIPCGLYYIIQLINQSQTIVSEGFKNNLIFLFQKIYCFVINCINYLYQCVKKGVNVLGEALGNGFLKPIRKTRFGSWILGPPPEIPEELTIEHLAKFANEAVRSLDFNHDRALIELLQSDCPVNKFIICALCDKTALSSLTEKNLFAKIRTHLSDDIYSNYFTVTINYPFEIFKHNHDTSFKLFNSFVHGAIKKDYETIISFYGNTVKASFKCSDKYSVLRLEILMDIGQKGYILFIFKDDNSRTSVDIFTNVPTSIFKQIYNIILGKVMNLTTVNIALSVHNISVGYTKYAVARSFVKKLGSWTQSLVATASTNLMSLFSHNWETVSGVMNEVDINLCNFADATRHNFCFSREVGYLLMNLPFGIKFENNELRFDSELKNIRNRFSTLPCGTELRVMNIPNVDIDEYELVNIRNNNSLILPGREGCVILNSYLKGSILSLEKHNILNSIIIYCYLTGTSLICKQDLKTVQFVCGKICQCKIYFDETNIYFKQCTDSSHDLKLVLSDEADLTSLILATSAAELQYYKYHIDKGLLLVCIQLLKLKYPTSDVNFDVLRNTILEKINRNSMFLFLSEYFKNFDVSYIQRKCTEIACNNDQFRNLNIAITIMHNPIDQKILFDSCIACLYNFKLTTIKPIENIIVEHSLDLIEPPSSVNEDDNPVEVIGPDNVSYRIHHPIYPIVYNEKDKRLIRDQVHALVNSGQTEFLFGYDLHHALENELKPTDLDHIKGKRTSRQRDYERRYYEVIKENHNFVKSRVINVIKTKNKQCTPEQLNELFISWRDKMPSQISEKIVTVKLGHDVDVTKLVKENNKLIEQLLKNCGWDGVCKKLLDQVDNISKNSIEILDTKPPILTKSLISSERNSTNSTFKDLMNNITEMGLTSIPESIEEEEVLVNFPQKEPEISQITEKIEESKSNKLLEDVNLALEVDNLNMPLHHFAVGFNEPLIEKYPGFEWLTDDLGNKIEVRNKTSKVNFIKLNSQVYTLARKAWTGELWNQYRYHNRVRLPARASESGVAASRAMYKCQQLIEQDPQFFIECNNILDTCCGSGGFAEALGHLFIKRKPCQYVFNTLKAIHHSQPDVDRMVVKDSNLKLVRLNDYKTNNIREKPCRVNYAKQCHGINFDLIIFDIGENSPDTATNDKFWFKKTKELDTMIDSVLDLQTMLQPGGKMILKISGPSNNSAVLINKLTHKFHKVKCLKLGTTPDLSNEYYLYCVGYNPNRKEDSSIQRSRLIDNVTTIECTKILTKYNAIFRSSIKRNNRLYSLMLNKPIDRKDWWLHDNFGKISQIHQQGVFPSGISLDFTNNLGNKIELDWSDPNWSNRISHFRKYAKNYNPNLRFDHANHSKFEHLVPIFSLARKKQVGQERNMKNNIIFGAIQNVFNMDETSATYCHTQSTADWREISFKKRIDLPDISPTGDVVEALSRALTLMDTEWGKKHLGKCRLLTKEEVLTLINPKGATSVLEPVGNLEELIAKYPNWYDICMEIINDLRLGKPTHRHYMARAKAEAKEKKNVIDGALQHDPGVDIEEMKQYNKQGHRYIQFSDGFSRLVDYIIFGDLLRKHNEQKMYKGSFNGIPPFILGNALKATWDLNEKLENRTSFIGENPHLKNFFTIKDPKHLIKKEAHPNIKADQILKNHIIDGVNIASLTNDTSAAGVEIDFSGWDGTVTKHERALLAIDYCRYYPKELHSIIKNCLKEQCFGIVIDDDQDVMLRAGQRGSGEWDTSFGNTKLVAANIFVAISDALGVSLEELLETVLVLHQEVGTVDGESKYKDLEITKIPVVCDGDDVIIFCGKNDAHRITQDIEGPLSRSKKKIHSGNETGAHLRAQFNDLSFCSHRYEPVLVGPQSTKLHLDQNKYFTFCTKENFKNSSLASNGMYHMRYLPTKRTSSVLSKLFYTLKTETTNLDLSVLNDNSFKELITVINENSDYYSLGESNSSKIFSKVKNAKLRQQLIGFDITRAKLHSYLYLYPHDKIVRWFCLGLLSVIGEEACSNYDIIKRYGISNLQKYSTLAGGLKSIFNVTSLDDITFRNHRQQSFDQKILNRNIRLTKKSPPLSIHEFSVKLFDYMEKEQIRDSKPITLCSALAAKFLKTRIVIKDDKWQFDMLAQMLICENEALRNLSESLFQTRTEIALPKLVIYSCPGSGKSVFFQTLKTICNFLKLYFNFDFHSVIDTDEGKIQHNSVTITNLPHLVSNLYPCIFIKQDKVVWDSMVKSKCSNWTDTWYDDAMRFSPFAKHVINSNDFLSNITYEIYKKICQSFNLGKRQSKYGYNDFIVYQQKYSNN